MESLQSLLSVSFLVLQIVLEVTLSVRVVLRRLPLGTSLAWIVVILFLPVVGPVLYLVVGENRLGNRRAKAAHELDPVLERWVEELTAGPEPDWDASHPDARELARLARNTLRAPVAAGNAVELHHDTPATLRRLIEDIDRARSTIDLEYYIWHPGGLADEAAAAVIRAARRGVRCRVLVDAVGSSAFLGSRWPQQMRATGVEVAACMPVGFPRSLFVRLDLRNHRKIAVVDREVAHTGSLNLADPAHFGQRARVGRWIDATAVIRGPAVAALAAVFEIDWHLETGSEVTPEPTWAARSTAAGPIPVQVLPSGPGNAPDAIHQVVLTAIYGAREELVISTPYFVPDEATLRALAAAAYGGVRVVLIIPGRTDHPVVSLACRSSYADLLAAGVEVWEFGGGLLHSKTVVVDRGLAMIGSLNMDMRSFWLNFEITLAVYHRDFAGELRELQEGYLAASERIAPDVWSGRPLRRRLLENTARLAAPLL